MRFAPLILALLCGVVLFTGLDRTGLIDTREARDAEVARGLVIEREPLTPLLGEDAFYEKPVLAYAPEVAVRLLAKQPDVVSREVRAIAGMLLVALTASIAAEYFGSRAGWFSALVL